MYFYLQTASTTSMMLSTFLPLVGIMAVMYFFMIAPQKKKEKKVQEMRSNLEIGDGVTTIGGIVGRVTNIKEDTVVIETGSSKIRVRRWSISEVEKLTIE